MGVRETILIIIPFVFIFVFLISFQSNSAKLSLKLGNFFEMQPSVNSGNGNISPIDVSSTPISSGDVSTKTINSGDILINGPSVPINSGDSSTNDDSDDVCTCPGDTAKCSTLGDAVLGGVDFVQYFTDFVSDGVYNESEIGSYGSPDISSIYLGYKYQFLSVENKAIFDTSPDSFIPQYGGFCSWGISGEFCPPYPWSADCLGPGGNWGHWTVQDGKLYFFLFALAKSKFLADPATYIAQGDARWTGWFPSADSAIYSTQCYFDVVTD